MSQDSSSNDYSRYFNLRQKVYLVNMSAERNCSIYESLSGVVTFCGVDSLELMISHDGHGATSEDAGKTTYKLTSEALGSGIQILADLTGIVAGNIFQFRMHGALEMFQRRFAARIDISAPIYHLHGNFTLATFRKKWKQVMDHLRNNRELPGLDLVETKINLSVGGVGLTVEPTTRSTPLSIFFIALDDGLPVCTVAETAWEQRGEEGLRCGFRFIHILKTDQERINNYLSVFVRKSGGTFQDFKRNWVLVDKMVSDIKKPE